MSNDYNVEDLFLFPDREFPGERVHTAGTAPETVAGTAAGTAEPPEDFAYRWEQWVRAIKG